MNKREREALIELIKKKNMNSGRVIKVGGIWHVLGDKAVPEPIINMPHTKDRQPGETIIIPGFWRELRAR